MAWLSGVFCLASSRAFASASASFWRRDRLKLVTLMMVLLTVAEGRRRRNSDALPLRCGASQPMAEKNHADTLRFIDTLPRSAIRKHRVGWTTTHGCTNVANTARMENEVSPV